MSECRKLDALPPVKIGPYCVGPGMPTFVIAEAGVNHDGRAEQAIRMVDVAAGCGADAVKIQLFTAKELVTDQAPTAAYQLNTTGDTCQQAMLSRLELPDDAWRTISDRCADRSIQLIVTPFGAPEVDRSVKLGTGAIKIASTDLTNSALLEKAVSTSIPLILSTGASTAAEIESAVARIRSLGGGNRLVLLHCVSRYPTPVDAINLRSISLLRRTFGVPTGLSDHTTAVDVGALAVAAGAMIIEKHFTLDKNAAGPDHAMSLSPTQLRGYIKAIRRAEAAMGKDELGMTLEEQDVRTAASRSVVAAADIPINTLITAGMLTTKRPGTGIPANAMQSLIGRKTRVPIRTDTTVSWDMVL